MNYRAVLGDRSLFPSLQARAYLNHAAISPPSLAVRAAVDGVLDAYAQLGVHAVLPHVQQRERLRIALAQLVGAQPQELGLTKNTTEGVVTLALCFPWKAGDRVVLFEREFPTNITPWQRAAELFDLELVIVPATPAALQAELDRGGVRLAAVSAVQFQTGRRLPLEAMAQACHRSGAQIFVDAVQLLGCGALDLAHIDYAAAGGHKWLMGPEGTGFLYVAHDRAAALVPRTAGWLSHEEPLAFLFDGPDLLRYDRPIRRRADIVENGVSNAMGFAALEASVALISQLGIPAISAHVATYLDRLETGLVERGFVSLRSPERAAQSGILAVLRSGGAPAHDLVKPLCALGISCTGPDGVLRFSPHWPNAWDEVPHVLAAVDSALQVM